MKTMKRFMKWENESGSRFRGSGAAGFQIFPGGGSVTL
jgi:hypothetical protein